MHHFILVQGSSTRVLQEVYQNFIVMFIKSLTENKPHKIARYRTPNARFRTLFFQKLCLSLHQPEAYPVITSSVPAPYQLRTKALRTSYGAGTELVRTRYRDIKYMKRGKILIVDDNEDILFTLKMLLRPVAESITTTTDPRELLPLISRTHFNVILLDMNFRRDAVSGKEGFHWLEEILKLDEKAVVIFITAYADTEKAVQAIKLGATDFIPKPWQNEKLIATVSAALQLSFSRTEVETLKQQKETLKEQTEALSLPAEPTRVIGESAAMQAIYQTIKKFSGTDANLLLLGENGTGKDLIARYVYEQSPRRNEIYVPIDLGSIPDTLFESELFGYEKGAFTDARKNKPGRVEVASGGTLFLNEIGNLSLPLQAKLLSVIEQRKSSRLGSTTSYPVDVRLICATNTDLYAAIDNGQFRQDLLYRINTIEIRIPPLRERGNDLFLLADFFLQRYRKKYKKELRGISKETRKMLQLYRWPGNVRELEHAIERAVILSTGTLLTADDFMLRSPQSSNAISEKEKYNLERMERDTINEVLRICGGNITLAAEMLGITRTSLYRRIEKFGL